MITERSSNVCQPNVGYQLAVRSKRNIDNPEITFV